MNDWKKVSNLFSLIMYKQDLLIHQYSWFITNDITDGILIRPYLQSLLDKQILNIKLSTFYSSFFLGRFTQEGQLLRAFPNTMC